jgi:hypothetical protein
MASVRNEVSVQLLDEEKAVIQPLSPVDEVISSLKATLDLNLSVFETLGSTAENRIKNFPAFYKKFKEQPINSEEEGKVKGLASRFFSQTLPQELQALGQNPKLGLKVQAILKETMTKLQSTEMLVAFTALQELSGNRQFIAFTVLDKVLPIAKKELQKAE